MGTTARWVLSGALAVFEVAFSGRRWGAAAAVLMALILAGAVSVGAEPVPRLRGRSVRLAAVIQKATNRSATFAALVEQIDRSDGVVYVEEDECGHGVKACLADVRKAGPNRFLRVVVDARLSVVEQMAVIGHELQHAIEVLSDPAVTSNDAMYFFYAGGRGWRSGSAFETRAALAAGDGVRAELRRSYRRR